MAKLQFYCQFQFSAQGMIGVVLAGRMALCEKLSFFCSDRSLAVCLTKKSLLHKFILGGPQDILNFFVFSFKKVGGCSSVRKERGTESPLWAWSCQLSRPSGAAGAECSSQKCAFGHP